MRISFVLILFFNLYRAINMTIIKRIKVISKFLITQNKWKNISKLYVDNQQLENVIKMVLNIICRTTYFYSTHWIIYYELKPMSPRPYGTHYKYEY